MDNTGHPTELWSPRESQIPELAQLLRIKETLLDLYRAEAADLKEEATWLRGRLNQRYDAYQSRFGAISRFKWVRTGRLDPVTGEDRVRRAQPGMGGFRADPYFAAVMALEFYDEETGRTTKAPVFSRAVVRQYRDEDRKIESPADALAASLEDRGAVDLAHIAALLDVDEISAREMLGTLVFEDPVSSQLIEAETYLSGLVGDKLIAAEAAAETEPRFAVNVEALRDVVPKRLAPGEIEVRLGASWIKPEYAARVLNTLLGVPPNASQGVQVEYNEHNGKWTVDPRAVRYTGAAYATWGTEHYDAFRMLEALLNHTEIVVWKDAPYPDAPRVRDVDETAAARDKAEELHEAMIEGLWADPVAGPDMVDTYNQLFNTIVLRTYDGSNLRLPGLSAAFVPLAHQRDAVARILHSPTTLLAHDVGAGKTAAMVMAGMELKRLGLAKKPMYVVPNHMLDQVSREFLQCYPQAKVLIADDKQLAAKERANFAARVAAGDWDGVVIGHSAFSRLSVSAETRLRYLNEELEELEANIDPGHDHITSRKIKQLKQVINAEQEALEEGTNSGYDFGLGFDELGVDYLFVDEAHKFKNLRTISHVRGLGMEGSRRAHDLEVKLRWLRESKGGQSQARIATFATATPISNSISELYTMMRYLVPDLLEAKGMRHFDSWVSTFAAPVTAMELAPDGQSYRSVTRIARFRNVPELLSLFASFTDFRSAETLGLPTPAIAGGRARVVAIRPDRAVRAYTRYLGERAEEVRTNQVHATEDNLLMISGDGRRAALDMRLVGGGYFDPSLSKVESAAEEIYRIWSQTKHTTFVDETGAEHFRPGGLQLVFCDLSTPAPGSWNVYAALREALIERGMSAKSVRFIHEASNDADRARLFNAARNGQISVLIGSSEKMGVGTNVQNRAVALHHLDCPWKPAELAQREGRILRQGNQNSEVEILRYVVEESFDTFSWQTVERKARFIDQILNGSADMREVDDVSDSTFSYAEVKAIATGNPMHIELAKMDAEVGRLGRLERRWSRDKRAGRREIPILISRIEAMTSRKAGMARALAHLHDEEKTGAVLLHTASGPRHFESRIEAGAAVYEELYEAGEPIVVAEDAGVLCAITRKNGQYGNGTLHWDLLERREDGSVKEVGFGTFRAEGSYVAENWRIIQTVATLRHEASDKLTSVTRALASSEAQLEAFRIVESQGTWPKAAELAAAKRRQKELQRGIELAQADEDIQPNDSFKPEDIASALSRIRVAAGTISAPGTPTPAQLVGVSI